MAHYTNLDGTTPDKGLLDILKWQVGDRITGKRRRPDDTTFVTPRRDGDGRLFADARPRLGWVGHATFVQRLGGKLIATDPIWSPRIHTIPRLAAPGIALEELPPLDIVTVSHAHFDHLDVPTLKRIGPDATYVVPKDNGDVLRAAGLTKIVELEWWESHVFDDLRITLVPAQHWSMRMPWDRNRRLWGGFVFESPETSTYHAGDTAFDTTMFERIAERFPRLGWAMLPIGAYDPTWFMKGQHMGPEEAVRAFELLGAAHFVAMHWGTFRLTDEPLGEPPERVRARWAEGVLAAERLHVLDIGQHIDL